MSHRQAEAGRGGWRPGAEASCLPGGQSQHSAGAQALGVSIRAAWILKTMSHTRSQTHIFNTRVHTRLRDLSQGGQRAVRPHLPPRERLWHRPIPSFLVINTRFGETKGTQRLTVKCHPRAQLKGQMPSSPQCGGRRRQEVSNSGRALTGSRRGLGRWVPCAPAAARTPSLCGQPERPRGCGVEAQAGVGMQARGAG